MNIDAFILIGGRSSRFGTDKAFVEIDGEPLAACMARVAAEGIAAERVVFVTANGNQFTVESLNQLGRSMISDQRPGFGAWSGIHTALSVAQSEWVFVTACDYPMISREFLERLLTFVTANNDAVVPRQPDQRLQPLCAFYRTNTTLAVVNEFLRDNPKLPPLTAMFEQLKTRVVEPEEYKDLKNSEQFFLNINTPADIENFS